jgi:hypothetical protein
MAMSDTMYVDKVPESIAKEIKPVVVGNDVQLAWTNEKGETVIVKNDNVVAALKREGFIERAIKRIKLVIAKRLGLYDMLLEFEKKHVRTVEAKADFAIILARAGADKTEDVEETKTAF